MRIFVTGSIAYDYIMVFPGRFRDHILPDKMHVLSVSFLVDSLTRLRGGTGANISFNLGLLGEHPFLVGTVGEDFADYRAWLEGHGVDCRTVKVIAGDHTASCFINTDLQDNQITAFYPGAMAHAASLSLAEAGVTADDLVVIAPNDPAAMNRYAAECIAAGNSLSLRPLDAVAPPGAGRPRERLPRRADHRGQRLRVRDDGRKAGRESRPTCVAWPRSP